MQQTAAVQTKSVRRNTTSKKVEPRTDDSTPKAERERKLAAIKQRLSELYKQFGTLTPELVVQDARDPRSPMHERFEWDDSTAAEAYRIIQARCLIKTIRYESRAVHTPPMKIPNYVRDPKQAGRVQGYIQVPRDDKQVAHDFMIDEVSRALGCLHRAVRYATECKLSAVAKALSSAIALLEPFGANYKKDGG